MDYHVINDRPLIRTVSVFLHMYHFTLFSQSLSPILGLLTYSMIWLLLLISLLRYIYIMIRLTSLFFLVLRSMSRQSELVVSHPPLCQRVYKVPSAIPISSVTLMYKEWNLPLILW